MLMPWSKLSYKMRSRKEQLEAGEVLAIEEGEEGGLKPALEFRCKNHQEMEGMTEIPLPDLTIPLEETCREGDAVQ